MPDDTTPDYPAAREHRDAPMATHLWNAGAMLDDEDGPEELTPKDLAMAQVYATSAVAAAIHELTQTLRDHWGMT